MNKKKPKLENLIPMTQQLKNNEEQYFTAGLYSFSSRDMSRLMLRTLYNLGLNETALKLEEESGLKIISETAEQFFSSIRGGEWRNAIDTSELLTFVTITRQDVIAMILELKFFELIDGGNIGDALTCLRSELNKHVADPERLGLLTTYLVNGTSVGDDALSDVNFHRSRASVIGRLRSHMSPDDVIRDFRLEELMGDALQWQSFAHGCCRTPPRPMQHDIRSKRLSLTLPLEDLPRDSVPLHTVIELCHQSAVWCLAFSPDGSMLVTASADGGVQLWLSDDDTAHFSRAVECTGATSAPLLLRWDSISSSFLCCCQGSSIFYRWHVLDALADDTLARLTYCTKYDQGFEVIFADFLPKSNVLLSCTRENHIFLCDMENNPLYTFVGGGQGEATAALLVATSHATLGHAFVTRQTQRQMQTQKRGWRSCPQPCVSSPSKINTHNTHDRETFQHSLLVSNSHRNTITLFRALVRCGDDHHNCNQYYDIAPIARLFVDSPVVSLAEYFHHHDLPANANAPQLALVTLLGGNLETISLSNQDGDGPSLTLTKVGTKRVSQSRFVVRASMDPSGRFTACGGEDGVVRVWDAQDWEIETDHETDRATKTVVALPERKEECPRLLLGHCGHVAEVSWARLGAVPSSGQPSQLLLASCSDDGTVRVWIPHLATPHENHSYQCAPQSSYGQIYPSCMGEVENKNSYEALFCGEKS